MQRSSFFLLLPLFTVACNKQEPDCSAYQSGDWAIQLSMDETEDGTCPYEGTFEHDGGEPEELTCGSEGDECRCVGGTEFGTYRIVITDTESGTSAAAVIEVESAPSPICYDSTTLEPLTPLDGMGGDGGSSGSGGFGGGD